MPRKRSHDAFQLYKYILGSTFHNPQAPWTIVLCTVQYLARSVLYSIAALIHVMLAVRYCTAVLLPTTRHRPVYRVQFGGQAGPCLSRSGINNVLYYNNEALLNVSVRRGNVYEQYNEHCSLFATSCTRFYFEMEHETNAGELPKSRRSPYCSFLFGFHFLRPSGNHIIIVEVP